MHHPVERTIHTAGDQLHRQAASANEDDNAAVNAALTGTGTSDSALQMGEHAYHAHKLKAYRQADKAGRRMEEANIRYLQAKQESEHPKFTSNPISRWKQRQEIRKEYAMARYGGYTAGAAAKSAGKAVDYAGTTTKSAVRRFVESPRVWLIIGLLGMLLIVVSSVQSCTPLAQSLLESVAIGTYPAEEADVLAAEKAYLALEKALQAEMDDYGKYHPEYNEWHVTADEIWHDPYVLIAIISACFDGRDWTIDTAMPVIEKYFKLQYVITKEVTTETRYRIEIQYEEDPDTGEEVPV